MTANPNPIPGNKQRPEWQAGLLLWGLLLAVATLLAPGLGGEFAFDDGVNLRGLADLAQNPDAYALWQFISQGVSSEIGRPLALLSFAWQYPSWPDHPADFIYVNLLLHLLNGTLLYWVLISGQRLAGDSRTGLALAVTALWVLAPIHANAVLYVIQRMAVLSATFVLFGILLHLKGRAAGAAGRPSAALALMTLGAFFGLGMGTLAKESAALYPLLVLVVEYTLLRQVRRPPHWQPWSALVLGVPVLLLCAYLLKRSLGLALEYTYRPYSLDERLLTEARVLFLYLKELFLPSLYSIRILYDDLEVSRSLLQPWTTLPAVAAWVLLLATALRQLARWPVFAFSVLWFLVAHLLESTFLPLELAFLHRNYLAVIGPLLGLVVLARTLAGAPQLARLRPLFAPAAVVYVALVAASLQQTAALWGDPREQARYWVMRQPDSRRAVLIYVGHLLRNGLPERAEQVLDGAQERWPLDASLALAQMHAACFYPQMRAPDLERLEATMARTDGEMPATSGALMKILADMEDGRCPRYAPADMRRILDAGFHSPGLRPARQNLSVLLSRAFELEGDRARARAALEQAIAIRPRLDLLEQAIYWALQSGDVATARRHLATAEAGVPRLQRWGHRQELDRLRALVGRYADVPAEPDR